jgi:hypothetical protein
MTLTRLECNEVADEVWVVRFLDHTVAPGVQFPPFVGVCTVVLNAPHATAHGMLGQIDRRHLREFMGWLRERHIEELWAKRAHGHKLPGGRSHGAWVVVNLHDLGADPTLPRSTAAVDGAAGWHGVRPAAPAGPTRVPAVRWVAQPEPVP